MLPPKGGADFQLGSSSVLVYDRLYSQTVTLYKIGCSSQVVRCAPKLDLECCWLWLQLG
jgi:hypothetical protein